MVHQDGPDLQQVRTRGLSIGRTTESVMENANAVTVGILQTLLERTCKRCMEATNSILHHSAVAATKKRATSMLTLNS